MNMADRIQLLRKSKGISQEELANLLGISRQTYSAIERKIRRMSWSTYLSLILFFDYNQSTHQMLRSINAFPDGFVDGLNKGKKDIAIDSEAIDPNMCEVLNALDSQATQTLRSVLMIEYARSAGISIEAAAKTFSNINFDLLASAIDPKRNRYGRRR